MTRPLCIYHGNCADGFTAAWVVRQYFAGEVDFHAGVYQDPPPDVTGRDVNLVDFSYKRDVLFEMSKSAKRILVLDHHKSAYEDLSDAFINAEGEGFTAERWQRTHAGGVLVYFDMERSGAGIAWDFFFPDLRRPNLVNLVEDRDLWRFQFQTTRPAHASLFSHPYDFNTWDVVAKQAEDFFETLVLEGRAIERKHFKDINEFIGVARRRMTIGGYDVPVLNAPYFWSSDAGHIMAQGDPFAACYWDTPDGRVFSLRSSSDGLDVSDIAKGYGGGGHKNASGFRVPFGHELAP